MVFVGKKKSMAFSEVHLNRKGLAYCSSLKNRNLRNIIIILFIKKALILKSIIRENIVKFKIKYKIMYYFSLKTNLF